MLVTFLAVILVLLTTPNCYSQLPAAGAHTRQANGEPQTVNGGKATQALAPSAKSPDFEDYATVEAYADGYPVYSLGNMTYIYGVSPELLPGAVMQEGNTNPRTKIKPKKSWEIKSNPFGMSMAQPGVRTMWNDNQPMLPIHLIDGDPDTVWSSYGSQVADARPEWIRIDLPRESLVSSVVLVCSQHFGMGNTQKVVYNTTDYEDGVLTDWMGFHRWAGRALPNDLTIQLSRDAWHWDTVYETRGFSGNEKGASEIKFEPRLAKQILITGNNFKRLLDKYQGYAFSLGEVEVRGPEGDNMALLSRGAGVTTSSTSYLMNQDRFTHDWLYAPVQYDLGVKWTFISADEGMHCWQYVEREKGQLQVDPAFDGLVTDMASHGLKVDLDMDVKANPIYKGRKLNWRQARIREISNSYYDNPGWAWQTPEMWQGYLRYVEFIVQHFKGRVAAYGLGADWPQRRDIYDAVLRIIKKNDPDVIVRGTDMKELDGPGQARVDAGPATRDLPAFFPKAKKQIAEARAAGFKGSFVFDFLTWSLYPPGPRAADEPSWYSVQDEHGFRDYRYFGDSEMVMAKTIAQGMVGSAGLGVLSFLFNPYFTSLSIGQAMFRSPVPAQTITPAEPEPAYYVLRTLCTVMDDWRGDEFPVRFSAAKKLQSFTLQRGGNELMIAAWIPGDATDGIRDIATDITLPGVQAQQAWVIDVFNGTEQKLVLNQEGNDALLKGMRIKDYPTLIRLEK
jgi:hypothetical protein